MNQFFTNTLSLFAVTCATLAPLVASADDAPAPGAHAASEDVRRYDLRGPSLRVGHTQTLVTRTTLKNRVNMTLAGQRQRGRANLKEYQQLAFTIDALDGEDVVQATEVTVAGSTRGTINMDGHTRTINETNDLVGVRIQTRKTPGGWSNKVLDPAPPNIERFLGGLAFSDWRELLPAHPVAIGESWTLDDSTYARNFLQVFGNLGAPADADVEVVATLRAVKSQGNARVARIALRQTITLNSTLSQDGKDVHMQLSISGTGTMRLNLRDYSYRMTMKGDVEIVSVVSEYGTELTKVHVEGAMKVDTDCHEETRDERKARVSLHDDSVSHGSDPLLELNANVVPDLLAESGD